MLFISITILLLTHDYVVDSLTAAAFFSFDMYVGTATIQKRRLFEGGVFSRKYGSYCKLGSFHVVIVNERKILLNDFHKTELPLKISIVNCSL